MNISISKKVGLLFIYRFIIFKKKGEAKIGR